MGVVHFGGLGVSGLGIGQLLPLQVRSLTGLQDLAGRHPNPRVHVAIKRQVGHLIAESRAHVIIDPHATHGPSH